jgi:hypothetical protein
MTLASLWALWDRFLFAPVSPYPVAGFRILYGLMVLQNALFLVEDLYLWMGEGAITKTLTVNSNAETEILNLLNAFPGNDTWLTFVFLLNVVSAICLCVGFQTRLASICTFLLLTSMTLRNPFYLNSCDTFIRMLSFWFIFAEAGAAWSVDRWLRRRKEQYDYVELIPAWGLRVLQLQVLVVYFHAFFAKTGATLWADGTAVYFSTRLEGLYRLPPPVPLDTEMTSLVTTWMTLAIEFSMFTLIWIREFRYYVLALSIIMHLTIDWTMNIPQYEWMMILSYLLFVYPDDIVRFLDWLKPYAAKIRRK